MKIFKKTFYIVQYYIQYFTKTRHDNPPMDNMAGLTVIQPQPSHQFKIPKIIWLYWQGNTPPLVQACLDQIKRLHPEYQVNILNPQNVNQYCKLDLNQFEHILPPHRADLIRLDLLHRYGGFWLDASIILYESLDWIIELMHQQHTDLFGYYRKKNTIDINYPVLENWLLATPPNNLFIKKWLDELVYALQIGAKQYISKIKQRADAKDILQRIGNPEYLVTYVVCQKIMHDQKPSLSVIDCDQNAFFYQVRSKWVKEKILIDLALNIPSQPTPKLIKLAHKERNFLIGFYNRKQYFKGSLIDI